MVTATLTNSATGVWDPCDRCGAAAAARITLNSGGQIHLCGHHLRDHRDRLTRLQADILLAGEREYLGAST